MTNYEWIRKRMDDKKLLAHELCMLSECETCTAYELCYIGHNGFLDWLDSKCEMTTREQWREEHGKN